ncbi:hypothetical protein ACA910_003658 [Epithemia clementina (nom. ined.)]
MAKNGAKKGGAAGGGDGADIKMNSTLKFAILDYPGVTQPNWAAAAAAVSVESSGGAATTTKEGQQGRRAKAGSGPKIESGGAYLIIVVERPELFFSKHLPLLCMI